MQQSTGQDAPKQTNVEQGPSIASMPERIDNSSVRENHDPVFIAITKFIISILIISRAGAIKAFGSATTLLQSAAKRQWI